MGIHLRSRLTYTLGFPRAISTVDFAFQETTFRIVPGGSLKGPGALRAAREASQGPQGPVLSWFGDVFWDG